MVGRGGIQHDTGGCLFTNRVPRCGVEEACAQLRARIGPGRGHRTSKMLLVRSWTLDGLPIRCASAGHRSVARR